jgi:DNA-binding transcriptional MerR regulator
MTRQAAESRTIPDKRYFRMGEVCKITGLKSHVLRYWESEFPQIQPTKTDSNQRVYRKKDIETIFLVKQLLYEKRYTIEGARNELKKGKKTTKSSRPEKADMIRQMQLDFDRTDYPSLLKHIVEELKSIRDSLDK